MMPNIPVAAIWDPRRKSWDTSRRNISDYRTQNGLGTNEPVPADAVTASASGLDPHISLRNAEQQTARVARVRGLAVAQVEALVRANVDAPSLGLLGNRWEYSTAKPGVGCAGIGGQAMSGKTWQVGG